MSICESRRTEVANLRLPASCLHGSARERRGEKEDIEGVESRQRSAEGV